MALMVAYATKKKRLFIECEKTEQKLPRMKQRKTIGKIMNRASVNCDILPVA